MRGLDFSASPVNTAETLQRTTALSLEGAWQKKKLAVLGSTVRHPSMQVDAPRASAKIHTLFEMVAIVLGIPSTPLMPGEVVSWFTSPTFLRCYQTLA